MRRSRAARGTAHVKPVAISLGFAAAFLAKGAGLISQLDQSILRRVPELSF
jgi:hypothetical protein